MNNEIRFYKKLTLLITVVFVIALIIVVLHYENDTPTKYIGKPSKVYTNNAIKQMIAQLPDYQGDSVMIDDTGRLTSFDGVIQSVIIQMYIVDSNLESIKQEAKMLDLPEPYLVYKRAIKYYLIGHKKKVLNKTDTAGVHP
jgi:hypothetical protein